MRLYVMIPFSLLLAVLHFLFSPHLQSPVEGVHLELLLLLAFCTAVESGRSYVIPAFWLCGVLRDLFLGERLGASTLLYVGVGLLLLALHNRALRDSAALRLGVLAGGVLLVQWIRPALEGGGHLLLSPGILAGAASSAVVMVLLEPVARFALHTPLLRTWRMDKPTYGLPEAG